MKRIGVFVGFVVTATFGLAGMGLVVPGVATAADGCAGAASMSTTAAHVTGSAAGTSQAVVKDVRVGQHSGCDRVTFEFTGGVVPGYDVSYVSKVVSDASGETVALSGSAFVSVVLHGTSTSTPAPQPDLKPSFAVLREVRGAGDFEATTSYGLGLSSKQPFLAYLLTSPDRLVIDIAAPAQVSQVPTGGVATGAGGTSTFPRTLLVFVGGLLIACGGGFWLARQRIVSRR
jgi:hypothetical protein